MDKWNYGLAMDCVRRNCNVDAGVVVIEKKEDYPGIRVWGAIDYLRKHDGLIVINKITKIPFIQQFHRVLLGYR